MASSDSSKTENIRAPLEKDGQIIRSEFFPNKGERALSIGQTGSGKTTFNCWLLERMPETPIVIYDTKHDSKFEQLKNHRVVETLDQADDALLDLAVDYVIFRPPPTITAHPQLLDQLLQYHEENWRGIDAYIDELYHFHKGPHAWPGLVGLYTRGRSRGITTIGSTQRPALISGFIFSESQLFYVYPLTRLSDRKRVGDFIEGFEKLGVPPKHHFYAYRQGESDGPKLFPPVPVADAAKFGYTDHEQVSEEAESDPPETDEPRKSGVVWL